MHTIIKVRWPDGSNGKWNVKDSNTLSIREQLVAILNAFKLEVGCTVSIEASKQRATPGDVVDRRKKGWRIDPKTGQIARDEEGKVLK
jgi:hypothetical protein